MSSVTLPKSLQLLERQFKEQILQQLPDGLATGAATSVRCARKANALAVLVQHPADVVLDPDLMLMRLEQVVQSSLPKPAPGMSDPFPQTVHLYLRYRGETRPYAMRILPWDQSSRYRSEDDPNGLAQSGVKAEIIVTSPSSQPTPSRADVAPATSDVQPGNPATNDPDSPDPQDPTPANSEKTNAGHVEQSGSGFTQNSSSLGSTSAKVMLAQLSRDPYSHLDLDSSLMLPTGFPGKWSKSAKSGPRQHLDAVWRSLQSLHPAIPLGILAGIAGLGLGIYALTRPCVIGQCIPLEKARQLRQDSLQTLYVDRSGDAVLHAYEQLAEASYLLGTIPPWSGYHDTAQDLLHNFETESENLGRVVDALEIAYAAADESQNPPHPIAHWQEIQAMWKEAIALLVQTEASSPAYSLAQQKLVEYKVNLNLINQRIETEQGAQEQVRTARDTAQLAQTRESNARTLGDWQLAHATWQTVVNLLESVPRTTMSYAEAQQLLAIYQEQLYAVSTRRTQEELAADAYQQALELADLAREAEQANQWSQAVIHWQDALNNLGQIPPETSYHSQAQPLLSSYQATLATAQTNLRVAVAIQNAPINLDTLCTGETPACSYTLTGEVVSLKLTEPYDRIVEQLMVYAPLDSMVSADVLTRSSTILQLVAAIGESAQIPVQLLNAQGLIFGSYEPRLAGFIQQLPEPDMDDGDGETPEIDGEE